MQRHDAAKKNLMGPILFSYYEESLVSSNLNSKLFRLHCVRPNVTPVPSKLSQVVDPYVEPQIVPPANVVYVPPFSR